LGCSIYLRSIKVLGENSYIFQKKQNAEEKNVFLIQRVHLPCPVLGSKPRLVSQAFDPVQIRPSCPEVPPPRPPSQRSLSTSAEQVPAEPFPRSTAPLLWEHREDSATGVPAWSSPRDSPARHRAFRILQECKEPRREKHWDRASPWVSTDGGNTRGASSSLKRLRLLLQQSQLVLLLRSPTALPASMSSSPVILSSFPFWPP